MDNITKFLERISTDPLLRERVEKFRASADALPSLAALSVECGNPVSEDELRMAATEAGEVSEAELDHIAAGGMDRNSAMICRPSNTDTPMPLLNSSILRQVLGK